MENTQNQEERALQLRIKELLQILKNSGTSLDQFKALKTSIALPMSHKQWKTMSEALGLCLIKLASHKDQECLVKAITLLDSDCFLREIVTDVFLTQATLEQIQNDSKRMLVLMKVLAVILQSTDVCNFRILKFVTDNRKQLDLMALIEKAASNREMVAEALSVIFRLFEAQASMRHLWDPASIYRLQDDGLVLDYVKRMVHDSDQTSQRSVEVTIAGNIELDRTLRVNKRIVAQNAKQFSQNFGSLDIELLRQAKQTEEIEYDGLVRTTYLSQKARETQREIEENEFRHLAVLGEEGSGKQAFVNLMCQENGGQKSIVVTLDETFDSKNLVGTYVCNEIGEFVFKKGPLTVAAENGMWLVLKNIDRSPPDILSFLLPLVQENTLQVTSSFTITPKLGFRIVAVSSNPAVSDESSSIAPFLSQLYQVHLDPLQSRQDFEEILVAKYKRVQSLPWLKGFLLYCAGFLQDQLNLYKAQLLDFKRFSVKSIFKLFERVELSLLKVIDHTNPEDTFISSETSRNVLLDIYDVYLSHIYEKRVKSQLILQLVADAFNPYCQKYDQCQLDPNEFLDYVTQHTREYGVNEQSCYFGRAQPSQRQVSEGPGEAREVDQSFVYTSTTLRLMEQIGVALQMREALLLVGETGTGKTSSVQELAKLRGKQLHVFNMNQNTDSSDLLGGFKPVDIKFLLQPLYELFLRVFNTTFKSGKNQQFLDLTQKCFEGNQVREFIQCINHGIQSLKSKVKGESEEIKTLEAKVQDLSKRAQKLESGGGFIFQFIEGTLIKSIQNGDWVLLDEINLASDQVLNKLSTVIEGQNILLNERADIVETQMHPEFRIFMCMNPPYTSAGKKQLPASLRMKLTELYVPELELETDLWPIVDRNAPSSMFSERQKRLILEFYLRAREHFAKQNVKANIGLRNLCRALKMVRSSVQLKYPVIKAIYDSLFTCFASHLDAPQQLVLHRLIYQLFEITHLPVLDVSQRAQDIDKYAVVVDFVIPRGGHKPQSDYQRDFILTPTFKQLVKRLASIVAVSDYAVILEGPTSAGKTSTVQYLANATDNKVIRINNHMHTDIQEYIGSYVPSSDEADGGKLVFQEGILVEAVRQGYWVILDELNLAPSEVLEALNRLLDDNRELHIVETQKTVKAHHNFRIFATQNPTEGYGGRKELSEAFKNRFILIKVGDVPTNELEEILVQKCSLPKSRAGLMVKTLENLQIYRSQGSLFSGKESTITVRDLLKWANRVNHDESLVVQDIAMEGFLVLAERSRSPEDKEFIKRTIESSLKCKIDEQAFYDSYFERQQLDQCFERVSSELGIPRLIVSRQLKRLAVLVHKCLQNHEPVLLVGETGCGKTTLCQVYAAINNQELFSINCHQNTETSDFIGCMRTRKNLQQIQDQLSEYIEEVLASAGLDEQIFAQVREQPTLKKKTDQLMKVLKPLCKDNLELRAPYKKLKELKQELNVVFEWHDGILVEAMQTGGLLLIDEISLANDSVLERLNSVFEAERVLVLSEKSSSEAIKIQAQGGFNIVATMNPSGDFGKKELSPALRNRMTEIWVESYFLQKELTDMYASTGKSLARVEPQVLLHIPDAVDLYLITKRMCAEKIKTLSIPEIEKVSQVLFNMIGFVNFTLASKFTVLQRKALSIRDIINLIEFIKASLPLFTSDQVVHAVYHAIQLVIMDGLCLGIDVAGGKQKDQIVKHCESYLLKLMGEVFDIEASKLAALSNIPVLTNNEKVIGVEPFFIDKKSALMEQGFAFDATTTKSNLYRLLRAYQLDKPTLIEGPPGVGKTSLVENLAKISGRTLTRVNLSEQTDMMDLLGSEYPTVAQADGRAAGEDDDIQFRWCDGALLRAIKEGHWFLIDEMNLAQQSVLEGLNAILDHRRTVYIPELNQEFRCHPDFAVFACQNPSQSSSSVGGRKTLPKSFLNRFNKIYLEELTREDYQCILQRKIQSHPSLRPLAVGALLTLSKDLESLIKKHPSSGVAFSDEGEINLRDLNRLLKLYGQFLEETGQDHDLSLLQCLDICYFQKMNLTEDLVTELTQMLIGSGLLSSESTVASHFGQTSSLRIEPSGSLKFIAQKPTFVGTGSLNLSSRPLFLQDILQLQGSHTQSLQFICDCLKADFPLLIMSDDCDRLTKYLQTISQICSKKLNRILVNERSDTTQLLGCFEQTSSGLSSLLLQLEQEHIDAMPSEILGLKIQVEEQEHQIPKQFKTVEDFIEGNGGRLKRGKEFWLARLRQLKQVVVKGTSSFQWVDSVLVKSIEEGDWVVFENANLCNPSILDRLNSLLEEGNQTLGINEQGLVDGDTLREVRAHREFRSIFLVSRQTLIDQGKDVSRALRNRCLQVDVIFSSRGGSAAPADTTGMEEETQRLISLQNSRAFNLYHEALKFDLFPLTRGNEGHRESVDEEAHGPPVTLGKRRRPESPAVTSTQALSSSKVSECYIFTYLSQANRSRELLSLFEPSIIDNLQKEAFQFCLTNDDQTTGQDWVPLYLTFKNSQLKGQIKALIEEKRNTVIMPNQSKKLLENIFSGAASSDEEEASTRMNKFLLLSCIHAHIRRYENAEILQSKFVVFMLKVIHQEIPEAVVRQFEVNYGAPLVRALMQSEEELRQGFERLATLESNKLTEPEIKQIQALKAEQEDRRQSTDGFVWAKVVSDTHLTGSKLSCQGLQGLLAHFTIICLNDDKDIVDKETLDSFRIAEMIADASPYFIMIPQVEGAIMVSASSQYEILCLMEDWRSLQSQHYSGMRLRQSWVSPIVHHLPQRCSQFSRVIGLLNLERSFDLPKQFELCTIDRILMDEAKQINLRDLPSFFYCSRSMVNELRIQLSQSRDSSIFLHIAHQFCSAKNPSGSDQLPVSCNGLRESLDSCSAEFSEITDLILSTLAIFHGMDTVETISALLVVPFEHQRLQQSSQFLEENVLQGELFFWLYHLRDSSKAMDTSAAKRAQLAKLQQQIASLEVLLPPKAIQARLTGLLQFHAELSGAMQALVEKLSSGVSSKNLQFLATKCELLLQLLLKAHDLYYCDFNHILDTLLSSSLFFVVAVRAYLVRWAEARAIPATKHREQLVSLEPDFTRSLEQTVRPLASASRQPSFQNETLLQLKAADKKSDQAKLLYESVLLQFVQVHRMLEAEKEGESDQMWIHALDYAVHREVAKKLAEEQLLEEQEGQVLDLPFKMKVQSLMDSNKAIDELTKEDVAQRKKEEDLEIEANFPSYFDEFQKTLLSISFNQPSKLSLERNSRVEVKHRQVSVEDILAELIQITVPQESEYRTQFLRLRLEIVQMALEQSSRLPGGVPLSSLQCLPERGNFWMVDAINCLEDQLERAQLRSVMNISELVLSQNYNFYHDTIPAEARLIFAPLSSIHRRLRSIMAEYESPLLNEVLFLCNYMMVTFNTKTTPLMKMLTGMELLLEKLDEWEAYASKRLNSCQEEILTMKQLIIRYRKIQILSWRNLLNHYRTKMVKSDLLNCVRLLHTIEKQIFDSELYGVSKAKKAKNKRAANSSKNLQARNNAEKVELEIFQVIDLFIRDSSLGLFESRLRVIRLLYKSLVLKLAKLEDKSANDDDLIQVQTYSPVVLSEVRERLNKVINIVHFILGYYGQFRAKLERTITRLDTQARDKIRTLIDVSKWTVQKFTQVKSNIDKTHRQLNRACRHEEEILMQNIQTLVLTSSRKKYIHTDQGGDGLLSLDSERVQLVGAVEKKAPAAQQQLAGLEGLLRQLAFFEQNQIKAKFPASGWLEEVMGGMFERLKQVRDVDRKHIQRRAFVDLFKFMRDQGLKPNFQDQLQPLLIASQLVRPTEQTLHAKLEKYYYKAHELLVITVASSQVDENSDLKNAEVIRIQGFTQSLMQQILRINRNLAQVQKLREVLEEKAQKMPRYSSSTELEASLGISVERMLRFNTLRESFLAIHANFREKLRVFELLEKRSHAPLQGVRTQKHTSLSHQAVESLQQDMADLLQNCEALIELNSTSTRMVSLAEKCRDAVLQLQEEVRTEFVVAEGNAGQQQSPVLASRLKLLQKYTQVLYQNVHEHVRVVWDSQADDGQKEQARRESFDRSTIITASDQHHLEPGTKGGEKSGTESEQPELSVAEQDSFCERLVEALNQKEVLVKIVDLAESIACMQGVEANALLSENDLFCLTTCAQVIDRIKGLLAYILDAQASYLVSLCKFSYLTQRIFLYLIYQGFCGKDEKEDEQEQEQRKKDDQFMDGLGMGDGRGDNNVSNEIEHEEQLEGLKNYESEEEQPQPKPEEQKKNEDEEEKKNDFEMENDFEGELEDVEQEEKPDDEDKKSEKSDDLDDALDKVDDMLDNQLWNQNMADMEQKEDEAGENEEEQEKDEIDLGDRELNDDNLIEDKEKELTAGDHDKQDDKKEEKKEDKHAPEDKQAEEEKAERGSDEDQSEGQDDENMESVSNQSDIHLDRDDQILDEEQPDPDQQSEAAPDEQMSDAESKPEENPEELEQQQDKGEEQQDLSEDKLSDYLEDKHDDLEEQGEGEDEAEQMGAQEKPAEPLNNQQDDQDDDQEADLKQARPEKNLNDQEQTQDQQNQTKAEQQMETQFDVNGSDVLFDMAQKIQEQLKQPNQERPKEDRKQESLNKDFQQVEEPQMRDEEKADKKDSPDDKQKPEEHDNAAEYQLDRDEAEQIQGRLAADQIDNEQPEGPDQEEKKASAEDKDKPVQEQQEDEDMQDEQQNEEDIQDTNDVVKNPDAKTKKTQNMKKGGAQEDDLEMQLEGAEDESQKDLVDDYEQFLAGRAPNEEPQKIEEREQMEVDSKPKTEDPLSTMDEFDYALAKGETRAMFEEWRQDEEVSQQSLGLLGRFKAETSQAAASLCEQLRIVLEPQLSQQLQGDYRTGKRLNMKKVISFIASHYRNDKIWLRRTLPSKRDYKILIAIDDSLSMKEQNLGFFSLEAMVTLVEALNRLEVGKIAVARIRDRLEILQSFEDSYSNERTAFIVSQYQFSHSAASSHDFAMASFVKDTNKLLDFQNTQSQLGGGISCPITIVLSDGRFNKSNVQRYMQEATEKRYLYIFVILDAQKEEDKGKKNAGILSLKSAVKQEGKAGIKLVPYLKDFPFSYYCIVRDLHQLPSALGAILVQYFSIMSAGSGSY